MSLKGKNTAEIILRGKINNLDVLSLDAYGVAVKNGFDGTVDEWLASLKALHSVQAKATNGVLVVTQKEN